MLFTMDSNSKSFSSLIMVKTQFYIKIKIRSGQNFTILVRMSMRNDIEINTIS